MYWRVYNRITDETIGHYQAHYWLTVREALYAVGGEDELLANDHNITSCTIGGTTLCIDDVGVELDDYYDPYRKH